ncbi:MAG: hypothetical protein ACKPKO_36620, partial [Candidatus Fonsibacter sp.]
MDEAVLNNLLYGTNPLQNFVGLIDNRNHDAEDNLKSEKQLSNIESGRCWGGWDGTTAETRTQSGKEEVKQRFTNNVVDGPLQ